MREPLAKLALLGGLLFASPPAVASDKGVTPTSGPGASAPTYLRQQKAPEAKGANADDSSNSSGLVRTSIALLLLGGLAGAALWMKRKRTGSPFLAPTLGLEVVSKMTLGPRSHVALVRVGKDAMLLGLTEQSITLLRTIPESELPGFDRRAELAPPPPPTFSSTEAPTRRATPPKATKPELNARVAFQDILEKASLTDAKRRADARRYAESLHREATLADEDEAPDSGPRARDEDEELPPHLRVALEETRRDAFGEPDGQAAELVRRFREQRS